MAHRSLSNVERLYHEALARPAAERDAFLAEACAGDGATLSEVRSLLAYQDEARRLLEQPAGAATTERLTVERGARLGPYEIAQLIGAGGMGEVYRARDTRLGRDVAVKVLPGHDAQDAEAVSRFTRETRAIAALNHPHICALYDVGREGGVEYLVMELLEGETLRERLARGPLLEPKAVELGAQLCRGLAAAHARGIIHRDLKPDNVFLTRDGVKILDFGLARWTTGLGGDDATDTRSGQLLGTVGYLSPEQARGQPADARSDVFALGAVLYEMLSGERVFKRATVAETLAAVLNDEPPKLGSTAGPVSAGLARIVRRCLEKDPADRFESAHDLAFALEVVAGSSARPEGASLATPRRSLQRERLAWGAALLLALSAAGALLARARTTPPPGGPDLRVEITTPATTDLVSLALSPDGERLAFVASSEGRPMLWVRSLTTADSRPLPGTAGASFPFWSPDSRSIGFFAYGRLHRIGYDGGGLVDLALAPVGGGATWSRSGGILFLKIPGGLPAIVPEEGGRSAPVAGLDPSRDRVRFPSFLPDGRRYIYYDAEPPDRGIHAASLDGSLHERLFDSDSAGAFAPPDRVAFVRAGSLFEQRLDMASLSPLGDPVALDAGVVVDNLGAAAVSASSQGWIAYRKGQGNRRRSLVRLDRAGIPIGEAHPPDANLPLNLSLSPDGRRLVLQRTVDGNFDLWSLELERRALTRLTSSPASEIMPVWSPHGDRVAFAAPGQGGFDLWQLSLSEPGPPKLLLERPLAEFPLDWSRDGRFLLYRSNSDPVTRSDIYALPVGGEAEPLAVANGPANETEAVFSPDGAWVAFESDETGQHEIYLQRFPKPNGKTLVSIQGGGQPQWRPDGREIFYVAPNGMLMGVALRFDARDDGVEPATPEPLFYARVNSTGTPGSRQEYVVAPDGSFLVNALVEEEAAPITLLIRRSP